jgi:hypothetical protein
VALERSVSRVNLAFRPVCLGFAAVGASSYDGVSRGISSEVERSPLSLCLCGAAVRATLAVPSLECRSGI